MPVAIMLSCAARSVSREPKAEQDLRKDLGTVTGMETKMWKTVLRAAPWEREYDAVIDRALDLGASRREGSFPDVDREPLMVWMLDCLPWTAGGEGDDYLLL